jgi:hypothetical protein
MNPLKEDVTNWLVLLSICFMALALLPVEGMAQVTQIQRWDGVNPGDGLGFFVKKLGDSGGNPSNPRQDGVPDLVIGKTCGENSNCLPSEGTVFVYSGQDRSLIYQINGTAWSYAVDAGDLDGDGVPDLLVGEMGQSLTERARVFSGIDGTPIPGLEFLSDGDLAGVDSEDGFGVCVSSIGDITSDGIPDLIVGAWKASYAVVYSGADGSRIQRLADPDGDVNSGFGVSVSEAGDVNGDGTPDFIVGAFFASPGGLPNAGSAFVISGRIDLNFPIIYRWDGENAGDGFGGCCGSVDTVGDLNGDGTTDLAAIAIMADPGGRVDAGSIYVFDGATGTPFQRPDGLGPLRFDGESPGDILGGEPACHCGWISVVGDVNSDGYPDFMAGAVGATVRGEPYAGRVLIFSGYDASVLVRIDNPDPSATLHFFGVSGTTLGDLDGDGAIEILLGAGDPIAWWLVPIEGGSAYLYSVTADPDSDDDGLTDADEINLFGTDPHNPDSDGDGAGDGFEVRLGTNPLSPASLPPGWQTLSSLPGPNFDDGFGWVTRSIADLDGDGMRDIAVGAPQTGTTFPTQTGSGAVYIYSGRTGALIRTIPNPDGIDQSIFGWYLVEAGDLDLDGKSDLLVGAISAGGSLWDAPGSAFAISGADGHVIYRVDGDMPGDILGWCLARIGDLNGDGVPELLIAAPWERSVLGYGHVKIIDGATGGLITNIYDPDGPNPFPNSSEGSNGFGSSVSEAGDVNGDGMPDFMVGAPGAAPDGKRDAGSIFVYSGRIDLGFPLLYRFNGEQPNDLLGGCCGSVDSLPDLNGDGAPEMMAAAPAANPNGKIDAGSVYIYSGADGSVLYRLDGENPEDFFGGNNCGCGPLTKLPDLDGDGVQELLIGAPLLTVGGVRDVGRVYLYSGASGTLMQKIENPDPVNLRMFGNSVDNAGDLSGDGQVEILIGTPTITFDFPVVMLETTHMVGMEGFGKVFVMSLNPSLVAPKLTNISTRARVLTGDNVLIGGFIIGGTDPKTVLIRARGPSMGGAPFNVPETLANPFVQFYSFALGTFIAQNDNWQVSDPLCAASGFVCGGSTEISATGLDPCIPNPGQSVAPPGCAQESAILITLPPGNYGAIVSGMSGGTGVGLVEVFEVGSATSRVINISTRAFVETGDNVEIGGFIIGGAAPKTVLIRARGPSMGGAPFNVPATLANPFVQLYSFATGTFIAQNDNWQVSDPLCAASGFVCGGATEISATGLDPCLPNPEQISAPPGCAQESAILITLPPGNYGAIVSGVSDGTGVGLVEVFETP